MDIPTLDINHAHYTFNIRGLNSPPDELSFEGREYRRAGRFTRVSATLIAGPCCRG
ncbi:hypothetical protein [Kluyvera intermedia]|jgi:hypothetical protein|uniref:hypothetical protein n=1 Tax=Kluyvera intermedia TaxID=61648 RepID=UPI00155189A5|nr:hypothetical protein [Kluyvera intermedia]